jgi:hypothetical protein
MASNIRSDLLWRKLAENADTFVDDPRLAAITEKVIDFMFRTEPDEWTKDQWQLFRVMYSKTLGSNKKTQPMARMSLDDLRSSLHGAPSTSED